MANHDAGHYTAMTRPDGESLPDHITLIEKEGEKDQTLAKMELLRKHGPLDAGKLMMHAPPL